MFYRHLTDESEAFASLLASLSSKRAPVAAGNDPDAGAAASSAAVVVFGLRNRRTPGDTPPGAPSFFHGVP